MAMLGIPIRKNKTIMEVDDSIFSDKAYVEIVRRGLDSFLNSRMAKAGSSAGLTKAQAIQRDRFITDQATRNLEKLKSIR